MPSLTIKNIPDDLFEALREAARAHHRSVNGEVIHCLERSLKPSPIPARDLRDAARELRGRVAADRIDMDEINEARTQGREWR